MSCNFIFSLVLCHLQNILTYYESNVRRKRETFLKHDAAKPRKLKLYIRRPN